ncbi:MAG: hypothetical protein OQL09_06315 [Gammaproteobacteria bacterium]|nr:hypothetical protein [Gammaproteobacteria bacterium]
MLLAPMLLIACTNNQTKQPEITEIFITDIKSSGLKLFSYSVTMGMPDDSSSGRGKGKGRNQSGGGGGMSGGMPSGKPNRESKLGKLKEMINEKLTSRLTANGYCREGYIELDSVIGRGRSQIRGECEEAATASDREKFPNTDNT